MTETTREEKKMGGTKIRCNIGEEPRKNEVEFLLNSVHGKNKIRMTVKIKEKPNKIYEYGIVDKSLYRRLKDGNVLFARTFLKANKSLRLRQEIYNIFKYGNPFGDENTLDKYCQEYLQTGNIIIGDLTVLKFNEIMKKEESLITARKLKAKDFKMIVNIILDKITKTKGEFRYDGRKG